jgi:hypothetical protein
MTITTTGQIPADEGARAITWMFAAMSTVEHPNVSAYIAPRQSAAGVQG